jgi:hypothetical protein
MHLAIDDRDGRVFDAWSWCESDLLEWQSPPGALERGRPVSSANPPGLLFLLRGSAAAFLPHELARLHLPRHGLTDERALAPYAIDDATDLLYERRVRPRAALDLVATSLEALVWGLHDWVHFHNHGPFDEPAATELQCDLVALAWLRLNREVIGVSVGDLARVASELAALAGGRFVAEGKTPPADLAGIFGGGYPAERAIRLVTAA